MHEHTAHIFIIMNKVGMLTTKVLFLKAVGERKERQEKRKQKLPKLTSHRNKTPNLFPDKAPVRDGVLNDFIPQLLWAEIAFRARSGDYFKRFLCSWRTQFFLRGKEKVQVDY